MEAAGSPVIPTCIHKEQFHPANKEQREADTPLGIKQPDITPTDLITA